MWVLPQTLFYTLIVLFVNYFFFFWNAGKSQKAAKQASGVTVCSRTMIFFLAQLIFIIVFRCAFLLLENACKTGECDFCIVKNVLPSPSCSFVCAVGFFAKCARECVCAIFCWQENKNVNEHQHHKFHAFIQLKLKPKELLFFTMKKKRFLEMSEMRKKHGMTTTTVMTPMTCSAHEMHKRWHATHELLNNDKNNLCDNFPVICCCLILPVH